MITRNTLLVLIIALVASIPESAARAQVLDKQRLLEQQSFWDNRDFAWYAENIPFFECPDPEITTTYYYRWDLLTKHLTYGSPNSGYSFTEFIDRPFWSGAYGAISCPAGHQLYEARWLRSPRIARDYSRYWFRTPGAQPRNYSTWLADSVWAIHQVHHDPAFPTDLLADLVKNYEAWEARHFVPEVGLFWQTGHDDGMEFNINSRQTQDILRGAPSYRPSFNSYMWADAVAIAKIARLQGNVSLATEYDDKAAAIKQRMIELLWDEKRQFFFPAYKNDEERDGYAIKALSKTYETGRHAGSPYGRELIGYVPWQFNLLTGERRFDSAWSPLMDRNGFLADFGPTTVERRDPMFLLQKSCCWWSGQSWPYATTQTLKALANLLQEDEQLSKDQTVITGADYVKLLQTYARSHRKEGKPYLAEALDPDTGSFEGHDGYNHSEHYFHSGFCDLIITGLVGVIPQDDHSLVIQPLAPTDWDYFAIDDLPYHGNSLAVLWDKSGERYGLGNGLHVLVNGHRVAGSPQLQRLRIDNVSPLSSPDSQSADHQLTAVNFAVNNDGTYYPRISASHTSPGTSLAKAIDGNYWYLVHPPNRWTTAGSASTEDWLELDFGINRTIDTVKLYLLDDSDSREATGIRVPQQVRLSYWNDGQWLEIARQDNQEPSSWSKRPLTFTLPQLSLTKLRVDMTHQPGFSSGITEIEAWGSAELPVPSAPPPTGNLAYRDGKAEYPKATASFSDRFGGNPNASIDGITNFLPSPMNRWTSYESPHAIDWLEIDFGQPKEFRRVELAIYDDRGGVQPPSEYSLAIWKNDRWEEIPSVNKDPQQPLGSVWNKVTFSPVTSSRLRISFTSNGNARSGVTEVMVWNQAE